MIIIVVCESVNHQFQSANYECIDRRYLCDGISQSADSSDERDCRKYLFIYYVSRTYTVYSTLTMIISPR